MAQLAGIASAVIVFLIWIKLIGNPHVVETVIGLILAGAAGIWVYVKAKKMKS
jgi:hypothetical protein